MRVTLKLDDDLLRALREQARESNRSIDQVVSGLVRSALRAQASGPGDMMPVFAVSDAAPCLTSEMVSDALDDACAAD